MLRISEFQIKDVVNVADGKKLGILVILKSTSFQEKLMPLLFQVQVKYWASLERMKMLLFRGKI